MDLEFIKDLNIPSLPGCYQFLDKSGRIIYIGKAANLRSRVYSYWRESANHTPAKQAMVKDTAEIKWIEAESEIEALLLEANLVKKFQPYYNVDLRDDKRFSYIKISVEDEIPGVFISRKIDKAGRYFGPFTSGLAVRETVKALRKIWPYCTERKIKPKPCFYYQIGRCTGVCGGRFGVQEYKDKAIKPIIMFLEGKKDVLIKKLEVRSKKIEKEISKYRQKLKKNQENYTIALTPLPPLRRGVIKKNPLRGGGDKKESFARGGIEELEKESIGIKYQLMNMQNVLEHTKIIGLADKYAADVVELAKILRLPKVPERIEGYDISNIFGQEAVGSMVVFAAGEPDKSEYRKFKIKIGQGEANDVGMLKEVLERRFGHTLSLALPRSGATGAGEGNDNNQASDKSNMLASSLSREAGEGGGGGWPLPDLIIVDGGKAQLNTALRVLKKYKLDIAVIAISKGEGLRSALAPDKLFFPGEKKPLELPLASPALHIIKRVRDEAHRFTIGYHRLLRKKEWLK